MLPLGEFIHELPKADLHLHLEGAIDYETLRELGARHGLESARMTADEIRARIGFEDFAGFLDRFKWITNHLREPEDYALITRCLIERLARENVLYAEITHSAGVVLLKRQEFAPRFEAMLAAAEEASARTGVTVRWILDGVRDFGPGHVRQVAEVAACYRARGVVALGIGGTESAGPPELFREVYAFARGAGLHLHAHAGETDGPASIWGALRSLGAERIGHGLTAMEDAELVDYLAQKQIPIEICLTSNLRTGALARLTRGAARLERHPLRAYFDRGLRVTLASDDPVLFETSLNREFELAAETFGFTPSHLVQLAEAGFCAAFLAPAEKERLLARFRERSHALLAALRQS